MKDASTYKKAFDMLRTAGTMTKRNWTRASRIPDEAANTALELGIIQKDPKGIRVGVEPVNGMMEKWLGSESTTPDTPFTLDVIEPERGLLARYSGRKIISLRETHATLNSEAYEAMGFAKGERAAFAVNPADRSVYIGILPGTATKNDYAVSSAPAGKTWNFGAQLARKQGIKSGIWEIIGKGKPFAGGTWFPLQRIAD